ncbi:helix-turn-helix domain-containing protein [Okeania sp. SIO1F9]|uniref:helix-turn-helix domain-containing protein n=1 Tax=Okeania sp. SIO1F9 TaxID=2607813 RepID=UPI00144D0D13|nr:helix-turn-helix domain-containing protein [Okeania sp. SIO1F9]NET80416.1 helix-turn-helix domain-containing protein [Okeania sp. SIO1F9]
MRKIQLTDTEKKTLEEGYKNHPKAHFRLRCHTLLLSSEGMTVQELMKITKTRSRTIYTWMDRWEKMGVIGLTILQGRGIKSKLSAKDEGLITLVKKK